MAKLSTLERKQFLLSRFEDQRHLLERSIGAMADGDLTEAMRVATSIRVLVHETGASTPLLKQLTPNYLQLPILDRVFKKAETSDPQVQVVEFFCPVSAKLFTDGKVALLTDLDSPSYAISILGAWWEGACMVLPKLGPISRRELILGLVNKEGGAHVDAEISARYKLLLESKFTIARVGDTDPGPLNISRLVAGKAGVELLDCLDRNFARKT